jgi:DNA repair protein RadC
VFVAVLLDGRNQVLGFNTVSVGSLTASLVHPREVFKPAILANAAAVILDHNHP